MQFTTYALPAVALPAIVALLAKAGIFFYARYSKVHNLQTRLYLLFLFALSIQNVAEIFGLTAHEEGLASPPSGTLYFGSSIFAIAFLLHLALLTGTNRQGGEDRAKASDVLVIYAPAVILEVLLWCTPLLVAGFESITYTYNKIPGPLYFLFQIYAVGYLCAAGLLLAHGWQRQTTKVRRLQNKLLLVGLLPWVVGVIVIIGTQQIGIRNFNTTGILPIAITFFLGVTAYAIHQHRLFDIEFIIPWSKIRKRKTEFYKRIQSLIAEIADMRSVNRIVQSISEVLRCPVVLVGGPRELLTMAGEALSVARFPTDELKNIDQIVVANEVAEASPHIYALMKRCKVAAVVPFHPHSQAAASWMLLGEAFSNEVYSPLDFKNVEMLFARLADHFLDKQMLLRNQLAEAQEEMRALQRRLALAWHQLNMSRRQLWMLEEENLGLRKRDELLLHHEIKRIDAQMFGRTMEVNKTLSEYITEFEAKLLAKTLEYCGNDDARAAEILGLPLLTFHQKLRQHSLAAYKKR